MIYPWQTEQWQQLGRAKQQQRLPHALLFTGIKGTGKTQFADSLIRALLCDTQKNSLHTLDFCNQCHACRLIEGKSHPNILWIEPENAGQTIKIDQIRAVRDFINQSSFQGEYRVVIINPAHQMNTHSANALLKTLEEPASGSIILLISDHPSRLPATVLSRCQRITFARPQHDTALSWLKEQLASAAIPLEDPELLLQLANGAPLLALNLAQEDFFPLRQRLFQAMVTLSKKAADPVSMAKGLHDNDTVILLDFLLTWIMDLLRLQLGADGQEINNKDQEQALQELCQRTTLKNNTEFMECLNRARTQLCRGINLNKQLLLESIFIQWARYAN